VLLVFHSITVIGSIPHAIIKKKTTQGYSIAKIVALEQNRSQWVNDVIDRLILDPDFTLQDVWKFDALFIGRRRQTPDSVKYAHANSAPTGGCEREDFAFLFIFCLVLCTHGASLCAGKFFVFACALVNLLPTTRLWAPEE
jgi:hypothetical protein